MEQKIDPVLLIFDQLHQVHEALAELKKMSLPGKAGRLVHVAELWQTQAMQKLLHVNGGE